MRKYYAFLLFLSFFFFFFFFFYYFYFFFYFFLLLVIHKSVRKVLYKMEFFLKKDILFINHPRGEA